MNINITKIIDLTYNDAQSLLEYSLRGITIQQSFDPNKVDYCIDTNTLPYRLNKLLIGLTELLVPVITELIEKDTELKVRKSIRDNI